MNTILFRMILSFIAFLSLLGAILATTIIITNQQKDDGLIVNLSGRQRMLTQKMTKETLIYSNMSQSWKDQVSLTMKVFETTLYALKDGGNAPLNLRMTRFRECPPAGTQTIHDQLQQVVQLWIPFRDNIQEILNDGGQNTKSLSYVIDNNEELLSTMNTAVFMMQEEAERKVALMVKIQGIAIAIGFAVFIGTIIVVRAKVVIPIKEMTEAADLMSRGNIKTEIGSSGLKEIATLSSSLNRVRISLDKMLERISKKSNT